MKLALPLDYNKAQFVWIALCAAVVLSVCIVDFVSRIYVATNEEQKRDTAIERSLSMPILVANLTQPIIGLQQQQQSLETKNAEVQATQKEEKPLLNDAAEIGNFLIKVQAVFISKSPIKKIALVTLQNKQDRNIELTRIELGQLIENYEVTNIDEQGVVFQLASDDTNQTETFRVNVFEKQNGY